tara:strand:- start:1205 stop:1897 length:693 start_codon:yes stop_codon:yes gene_type:complete
MPDDRYVLPPKEQAAKDRIYAYLTTNASPIMDVLHTMSMKETAEKLTHSPNMMSLGKIMWVVAIREIFDQSDPGGGSPVGTWESIDKMRMMASSDIRLQVAEYVSDIWMDKEGEAVDCRIAVNHLVENGLHEICGGREAPHFLGQAMGDIMVAAMEGLITAHECFGEDGIQPDEDRLRFALESNAEAYAPEHPWMKDDEDMIVSGASKVVANFEKLCKDFRKEVNDGESN